MKRPLLIITIFSFLFSSAALSQTSLNASGSISSTSFGSVSNTFGQPIYSTVTNSTGAVHQGIQQAFEIYTLGVQPSLVDIKFTFYPNPTLDNLTIELVDFKMGYNLELYNSAGQLLTTAQLTEKITLFDFSNYPKGSYFLTIKQQKQIINTSKILKN